MLFLFCLNPDVINHLLFMITVCQITPRTRCRKCDSCFFQNMIVSKKCQHLCHCHNTCSCFCKLFHLFRFICKNSQADSRIMDTAGVPTSLPASSSLPSSSSFLHNLLSIDPKGIPLFRPTGRIYFSSHYHLPVILSHLSYNLCISTVSLQHFQKIIF